MGALNHAVRTPVTIPEFARAAIPPKLLAELIEIQTDLLHQGAIILRGEPGRKPRWRLRVRVMCFLGFRIQRSIPIGTDYQVVNAIRGLIEVWRFAARQTEHAAALRRAARRADREMAKITARRAERERTETDRIFRTAQDLVQPGLDTPIS